LATRRWAQARNVSVGTCPIASIEGYIGHASTLKILPTLAFSVTALTRHNRGLGLHHNAIINLCGALYRLNLMGLGAGRQGLV